MGDESQVNVPESLFELHHQHYERLCQQINPLSSSENHGIEIYEQTLQFVDHTGEDRANVENFVRVSDAKPDLYPMALLTPLLDIINQSTKRISKRRLPIVCKQEIL